MPSVIYNLAAFLKSLWGILSLGDRALKPGSDSAHITVLSLPGTKWGRFLIKID